MGTSVAVLTLRRQDVITLLACARSKRIKDSCRAGPIVAIAEGDLPVLDPFQGAVGDRDAEDVAAQIVEDLLAAPGGLAVNDPRRRPDTGWHLVE